MITPVIIVIAAAVATVSSSDILIGKYDGGEVQIFNEEYNASPLRWRQTEVIWVNAPRGKVISRINITDHRPEKDGCADITHGDVGDDDLCIELNSPTLLRGYSFHIEVYALPESEYEKTNENKPKESGSRQVPAIVAPLSTTRDEPRTNAQSTTGSSSSTTEASSTTQALSSTTEASSFTTEATFSSEAPLLTAQGGSSSADAAVPTTLPAIAGLR